jgi:hypothetical protein
MKRTLHILFRRDPAQDRRDDTVHYEGYRLLWPDGSAVGVAVDSFCKHGQRLLGLGRHLAGHRERLVEVICFPLRDREDNLNRLPGARVRRFCLRRTGPQGRLHFLDGTPTSIVFDLDRDERVMLDWVGLTGLADGEDQWFDLAARPADGAVSVPTPDAVAFDTSCRTGA